MFGFVKANLGELAEAERQRYNAVYCGICRQIRLRASNGARLGLQYDMAFLALLLMSLYEPEEQSGDRACALHPIKPKPWVDNEYIQYAADMNVALAYYKAADDCRDEKRPAAAVLRRVFGKSLPQIQSRYPRQCRAMEQCLQRLHRLEQENCPDPDAPAGCFGELMGQLLCFREDLWQPALEQMGMALGRFIYLADAVMDYRRDKKKKQYNPFLAAGMEENRDTWERYLVMAMSRCTDHYERLPLVQDKKLLDNILYSGVWVVYRGQERKKQ